MNGTNDAYGGENGNRFSGTFNFRQINLGHILLGALGMVYGVGEHNYQGSKAGILEQHLADISEQLAALQVETKQIAAVQIQMASITARVDQLSLDYSREVHEERTIR